MLFLLFTTVDLALPVPGPQIVSITNSGARQATSTYVEARAVLRLPATQVSVAGNLFTDGLTQVGRLTPQLLWQWKGSKLSLAVDLPSQFASNTTLTAEHRFLATSLYVRWSSLGQTLTAGTQTSVGQVVVRASASYALSDRASALMFGASVGRMSFDLFAWVSASPSATAAFSIRV